LVDYYAVLSCSFYNVHISVVVYGKAGVQYSIYKKTQRSQLGNSIQTPVSSGDFFPSSMPFSCSTLRAHFKKKKKKRKPISPNTLFHWW